MYTIRMRRRVSPAFQTYLLEKYPALRDSIYLRRMMLHICLSCHYSRDKDGKALGISLSHSSLSELCDDRPNHFNSGLFLLYFQGAVLPNFAWQEFVSPVGRSGRSRYILDTGLDDQDLAMIRQERLYDGKKVYFDTGRIVTAKSAKEERDKRFLDYIHYRDKFYPLLNKPQKLLIDYLESHNSNTLIQKNISDNKEYIYSTIESIVSESEDRESLEDKKDRQYRIVGLLQDDARIYYQPSPKGHTARLHHFDECLLSLKRSVRKAVCKGFYDLDLVSSQFVIISAWLQARNKKKLISTELLDSGISLWTYFEKITNKLDRDLAKTFIYSLCYGQKEYILKKMYREIYYDKMVQELLSQREDLYGEIAAAGSLRDFYGKEHKITPKGYYEDIYGNMIYMQARRARSLFSTLIQSIEFEIISSCFSYLAQTPLRCDIICHQHDGFTLHFPDVSLVDRIIERLREAVRTRSGIVGKKLGIDLKHIRLDVEKL